MSDATGQAGLLNIMLAIIAIIVVLINNIVLLNKELKNKQNF